MAKKQTKIVDDMLIKAKSKKRKVTGHRFNNGYLYIYNDENIMFFTTERDPYVKIEQRFNFDYDPAKLAPLYEIYTYVNKHSIDRIHSEFLKTLVCDHSSGCYDSFALMTKDDSPSLASVYKELGVSCISIERGPANGRLTGVEEYFWHEWDKTPGEPVISTEFADGGPWTRYKYLSAPDEIFSPQIIQRIIKEELPGIINIILSPFELIK